MPALTTVLTIDETSGVQNVQTGFTSNDTSASLPQRLQHILLAEGVSATTPIATALSGVDGTTAHADGTSILTLPAHVIDVALTDASGNDFAGVDSGLTTTGGASIFLYTSATDNNAVVARVGTAGGVANPAGAIAFVAFLDTGVHPATDDTDGGATGAKLWLVQYETLHHPDDQNPNDLVYLAGLLNVTVDSLANFSLEGAPSGQNLFLMFGDGSQDPAAAIIVTGKAPANQSEGLSITGGDTVNTGQGGGGTTIGSNNQMIDPNEGMYFTFVRDPAAQYTVPNLDQNEADVEANIQFDSYLAARSASFALVQLQPPKSASIKLTAINNTDSAEKAAAYIDGLGDSDDVPVNITSVTITRGTPGVAAAAAAAASQLAKKTSSAGTYTFSEGDTTLTQDGITVDFTGNTLVIKGLVSGDTVAYHTAGDHNRVLVENTGTKGSAAFDIGGFQLGTGTKTTSPLDAIAFADDGPSGSIERTVGTITLDESIGASASDPNAATDDITADNTDPFAAAYGSPIGALSAVDLVDTTSVGGQDDEGAASAITLKIVGGDGSDSGLKTTDGTTINLWLEANGEVTGRAGDATSSVVFAIKIDADGKVSMAQYDTLQHPTFPSSHDESQDLTGKLSAVLTVTDGDGDTASSEVDIGAALAFHDDGPSASTNATVQLDDDALAAGNAGGTGDVDPDTANLSGTLGHDFGSDGAGSVSYLTTGAPTGFTYEAGSSGGLLVKQGSTTVMTLTLDASTGAYTVTQNANVLHVAALAENNQEFNIGYRVTDGDSDTADGTLTINVDDDTPSVVGAANVIYANASNPTPGGTGIFAYSIGADQHALPFSSSNSDFSSIVLQTTGSSIGGRSISAPTVTWASETASSAVFDVAFAYQPSPAATTTTAASGTLTFDKTAGTYTLALAQPIQSYTILTTSTAQGFTGYELNSTTPDATQPSVSVAALASNFFVQFSGYSEPGGGTGDNNLYTIPQAGTLKDATFDAGDVFKQANSWVSVSGSAAGVAGDTIQKGEVLDLDFFTTNPSGYTSSAPDAAAVGVYLKFDGINNEDMVVVLKLFDGTTHTTKAIVVDNGDIFRAGSVPASYSNIALDNNDGVVIIESNDFNAAGEHYVIEGAQVLVSTEGLAGSGVALNPATGDAGGSSGTQAFGASTTDNDVVKIADMGFLSTVTPDSHLNFSATVADADGDAAAPQALDVTIVSSSVFAAGAARESLQGRSGVADTFAFDAVSDSPTGSSHDVVGGFVSGTDRIDLSGIDANSTGGTANDAFTFLGTAAFGGVAGQLRFDAASKMLLGDVNGDGSAELAIELAGVSAVAAADLIL